MRDHSEDKNHIRDLKNICSQISMTNSSFGVCLKDCNGKVLYQSNECLGKFAFSIGSVCDKLCMQSREKLNDHRPLINGIDHLIIQVEDSTFEVIHLNDKDLIYTIYQNLSDLILEKLKVFQKFRLTQSELKIIEEVLKGKSTQMILNTLFISKPTLRTHLNNIYKKIPKALKKYLLEVRGNRKINMLSKIDI